jgi:hypothetical protein
MFKVFMFNILQGVLGLSTVGTFLTWRVVALILYVLSTFLCHTQTIYTFSIRTVSTMRLLHFLLCHRLCLLLIGCWTALNIFARGVNLDCSLMFCLLNQFWLSPTYLISRIMSFLISYVQNISIPIHQS